MTVGPWAAPAGRIRIIQRPEGEAPEWVRDAWIGLELPLLHPEPITTPGVGVLSGPKTWLGWMIRRFTGRFERFTGYLVDANDAVLRLEKRNPTAAIWWRTHAGALVAPGGEFIFDTAACEVVTRPPDRR